MYCKTTVKLILADSREPLAGVRVQLWDRDRITPDDLLGTQVTDSAGEACFDYETEKYLDLDDRLGGHAPELYVVVLDTREAPVLSTRTEAAGNSHRRRMTVPVERAMAERAGLFRALALL